MAFWQPLEKPPIALSDNFIKGWKITATFYAPFRFLYAFEKLLKSVNGSPLYIEIASSPGGIDIKAARDAGVEIVLAPSLPGRYAPVSAGKYVFETISEILSERRIKI